jgi:hypothetical protein
MQKTTNMLKAAAMCLAAFFCAALCAQDKQTGGDSSKATGIATQILNGEKRDLQFGPYKWRVLEVKGDRALMITEDVVEKRAYHGEETPMTWEACDLRKYLNGDFLQKFSEDEKSQIAETLNTNPDEPMFKTKGGADTTDKVFLLSFDEAGKYLDAKGREASISWWLRSPGYKSTEASGVFDNGKVRGDLGTSFGSLVYDLGVRPALWLNLKP